MRHQDFVLLNVQPAGQVAGIFDRRHIIPGPVALDHGVDLWNMNVTMNIDGQVLVGIADGLAVAMVI